MLRNTSRRNGLQVPRLLETDEHSRQHATSRSRRTHIRIPLT